MAISTHKGPNAIAPASNHKYDQEFALIDVGLCGAELFNSTLEVQLYAQTKRLLSISHEC